MSIFNKSLIDIHSKVKLIEIRDDIFQVTLDRKCDAIEEETLIHLGVRLLKDTIHESRASRPVAMAYEIFNLLH